MKHEIKQFGKTILWAEGEAGTSCPMIFRNMTGRNFSGLAYRHYIENWILQQCFELCRVELWEDGALKESGRITLSNVNFDVHE